MSSAIPQVSIVLPTFDRLRHLRRSIDSVFEQTFGDWELIIADDGSGPETREYLQGVAADSRVTVLWLPRLGNPGAVRNAALAHARAPYVAFLDSDDYWLPEKLARQVPALRAAAPRRWCYTAYECVDAEDRPVPFHWIPLEGALFAEILRMQALVAMPTVLAERALVCEVGGFDPGQVQHGDYELWLRMILASELALLDEPLARVRNHGDHYTRGGAWSLRWKKRMLEKMAAYPLSLPQRQAVRRARITNVAQRLRVQLSGALRSLTLRRAHP